MVAAGITAGIQVVVEAAAAGVAEAEAGGVTEGVYIA